MRVCTYGAEALTTCVLTIVLCSSIICNAEDAPAGPRRRALAWASQGFYVDTFGTNADPPRYLYPTQEELERMLTGDPGSRRRYAALLPLRLACDPRNGILRPSPAYQRDVLRTIVRQKWIEAIPLLAYGMQETAPDQHVFFRGVFDFGWEHNAADVWLWLATQDMDKDAELEFILRILKGEEPSVEPGMMRPLADAVDRETRRLVVGVIGGLHVKLGESLLGYLSREDVALKSAADLDRACLVGRLMGKYVLPIKYLPQIEDYLTRVAEKPSLFNHVVVLRAVSHLASPGDHPGIDQGPSIRSDGLDALCRELCEGMWHLRLEDPALTERIRSDFALSSELGVEKIFGYLKELNESPEPYAGNLIVQILQWFEYTHRQKPLPAEVVEYLRRMAADPRYGPLAVAMKPDEELLQHIEKVKTTYNTYTTARGFIDRILAPRDGE